MGFTALRYGDGISGIILKDGGRVAGATGELADDLARQAVRAIGQKVFRSTGKKFSRVTFSLPSRDISAWDCHCFCFARNGGAFRDKLVTDFILASLNRWINDMSLEMRWLIEMACCNTADVEKNEPLNREIVRAILQNEVHGLMLERGRALEELYARRAIPYHVIVKGASPL